MTAPNPIDVACPQCEALAGAPCRSFTDELRAHPRPIVVPHMRRLRTAGLSSADAAAWSAGHDAYARAVLVAVFGRVTPELLERARRDRAIDVNKPWVRRALGEDRS